jgi:hypothetical protein
VLFGLYVQREGAERRAADRTDPGARLTAYDDPNDEKGGRRNGFFTEDPIFRDCRYLFPTKQIPL